MNEYQKIVVLSGAALASLVPVEALFIDWQPLALLEMGVILATLAVYRMFGAKAGLPAVPGS